ncbi:MAG: AI-2E family transporter, partial [Actinomycetota bacterium]|nr:AI-2E family transporter [Actinomycetota bacterium]
PVPIRTMLAVVASVIITVVVVDIMIRLHQVVVWTVISAFFAAVLHAPVSFLMRTMKLRRSVAALLVFLAGIALVAGLGYQFVRPLASQVNVAVNAFPGYVADARAGRGTIGQLVKRYQIDAYVERNQPNLKNALKTAEKPAVQFAKDLLNTLTALATITVMTFLLLIDGPRMLAGGLAVLSPPAQDKVGTVVRDVTQALAGYMGGVLATSVLAGVVAYFALWALGVPFRGVLALWIGFTTLIPLLGIFLGVLPAAAVAFIHSPAVGLATVVILFGFYLLQNRTLGKWINARTIALSPLAVAVSVLAGLQLLGFLGALLAIPLAGVIHVVIRDLWAFRSPRVGETTPGVEG